MGYINGNKVFQVVRTEHILSVDDELSTVSENPVQNKVVTQALNGKVDKVAGKGLSTNDFTDALKNKLDGIEAQANKTIVDSAMSGSSTNPVQNKVVKEALDDKANTSDLENGGLVVAKALSSKSIENVSEESGSTQEDPFIHQGTGTENNTSETPTSPVAKQLEKQGNTVCKNMIWNTWRNTFTLNGITFTYNNDGSFTLNGTSDYTGGDTFDASLKYADTPIINGHRYLWGANGLTHSGISYAISKFGTSYATGNALFMLASANATQSDAPFILRIKADAVFNNHIIKPICRDLDQWFNGDIPQDLLDNPSHFSWYYNGDLSYNAGALQNSNGRYLVCGERNLFNPATITKNKYIDYNTGVETAGNWANHSDYILVVPNKPVYVRNVFGINSYYCAIFFNKNKQFIGGASISGGASSSGIVNIPANAQYLIVNFNSSQDENDVDVSLYYETGDSYDQHYDYKGPNVYDTGTEVLRSAGSAKDTKAPDGTIIRKIGSYTFTGSESWSNNGQARETTLPTGLGKGTSNIKCNIICNSLITTTADNLWAGTDASGVAIGSSGKILVGSGDVANMTGKTIYYELATPTTEQGTSFAENIEIDDYGTMEWLDTNEDPVEIPQGVKIFYPADYVLLLDDLNSYTDGDVTKLAKKTDVADLKDYVDLRIPTPPTTDGTYTLKATVSNGVATYSWVLDQ